MQSIPLGLVTVITAGTPVNLTLSGAQAALLPPSGQVAKIEFWPNPAAAGKVYVKVGGVTLAALMVPASGAQPFPFTTPEREENSISPLVYQIDAATNGDGAFVTLWVA